MIDNQKEIIKLLTFDSEDDFYHLQIIKRKKEHPELGSNSYIVKTYYISSVEYLNKKFEEIKVLCDFHNARACINLNRRSFEKLAYQMLIKVTNQIVAKDYRSVRKAFESVCGVHSNEKDKRWIIDCDFPKTEEFIKDITKYLWNMQPIGDKVIAVLDTKNGFHLITKPFNKYQFKEEHSGRAYSTLDIHTNNPTIYYCP